MKTILFTATALSLTGAALANGNEWSALDREVETLASSLVDNHEGMSFTGYADIFYNNESDADTADFGVNNARIMASGGSGGFGANVEYNLATSTLLDAYITQDLGGMTLGAGRHKVVGNASSMQHERDMFFQTRSNIGYHFVNRDEGITLSGGDGFNWSIGIADGDDTGLGGDTSDYRLSAHADMDFGGGIAGGVTYTSTDNGDVDGDGSALIIDLSYTMDALNISFEMAQIDDNGGAFTGATDGSAGAWAGPTNGTFFDGDSSPMSIVASYDLGGESSIGVRIQDNDDGVGTEAMDVVYNYGMYSIQYSTWESDADAANNIAATDSDRILIGLQVGF